MIYFFTALASTTLPNAEVQQLGGTALDDVAAIFAEMCFSEFPNTTTFEERIGSSENGFTKQEKDEGNLQPGDIWTSEIASVFYSDANWLPRSLPSPQCTTFATLDEELTHSASAQHFANLLGLQDGDLGRDRSRSSSRWDFEDRNGNKIRVFFATDFAVERTEVKITIMNLRD